MNGQEVIRKTTSFCPECKTTIPAEVIKKDGKIFLCKLCPEHKAQDYFLGEAKYHESLEDFYFKIRKNINKPIVSVELVVNFSCNMNCPVCFLGDNFDTLKNFDPTVNEIESFIKKTKYKSFVISGAEATCRDDLFEIIKILKKYSKTVGINTNGLKLAEFSYVKKLKAAGVDRVNLQFSGFNSDAEKYLRGEDYINQKLKALENLNKLNIAVGLNALIAGNCNEDQIGNIIEMVSAYRVIKMVNFGSMVFTGLAKDYPRKNYIMPDDLLRFAQEQTKNKIKRQSVYIFKKLEIVIASFFNKDTCFYHHLYLIVKKKNSYKPIDKFLNLEKIESVLEQYKNIYGRSSFMAKIYLIMILPYLLIINYKIILILGEIFQMFFSYFFKKANFLKQRNIIYLLFFVECDVLRIDYDIFNKCPFKSIFFFDKSNNGFQKKRDPIENHYWFLWKDKKN
ncbi:MAG: radical SAM protein [Candidatus Omnitrophota bacterium]